MRVKAVVNGKAHETAFWWFAIENWLGSPEHAWRRINCGAAHQQLSPPGRPATNYQPPHTPPTEKKGKWGLVMQDGKKSFWAESRYLSLFLSLFFFPFLLFPHSPVNIDPRWVPGRKRLPGVFARARPAMAWPTSVPRVKTSIGKALPGNLRYIHRLTFLAW